MKSLQPLHTIALLTPMLLAALGSLHAEKSPACRERLGLNESWCFRLGDPQGTNATDKTNKTDGNAYGDSLSYYKNPAVRDAVIASSGTRELSPQQRLLGAEVAFTKPEFDDQSWRKLDLPHDWAIEGPFDIGRDGGTGKLPSEGVGWYRKHFKLPSADAGKRFALEIDGAMSHAMVWCNGQFVGGWPYGYSSFSLDLTAFLKPGKENVIAVRLDNPPNSSRWYPGGGIYRNVWLTKTSPVHVGHWGTTVTASTPSTPSTSSPANPQRLTEPSLQRASVKLSTTVVNEGEKKVNVTLATKIIPFGAASKAPGLALAPVSGTIAPGGEIRLAQEGVVANPKLWDITHPDRYLAVTTVSVAGKIVDRFETPFGIREIKFTPDNGFLLNGKRVQLNGVCNHHDLGALGAAFNERAAERQLEILKEMGVNALRTSHNMPAPELLDLCDRMGILVMDESFDCWARAKTGNDYHRLWADWHERDLRAEIRRDRNHPSVIMWSLGNEIPEQGSKEAVPIVEELVRIAHEEDPTRPAGAGGNGVWSWTPQFAAAYDLLGQNYDQNSYPGIRKNHPAKPLFASETSSCVSSRGEYFFQTKEGMETFNGILRKKQENRHAQAVKEALAAGKPAPSPMPFNPEPFRPVSRNTHEGGMENFQVSSYDLYAPGWAQIPDDEFLALDKNPFVAGEFVWTGFDYLGEPTPFNADLTNLLNFRNDPAKQAELEKQLKELGKVKCPSRSSYFGIVDLCGFPKDRFYLYQSRWRPELPMAHILPHWNWPDRLGKITPVHVYTSGDEAELFLNGKSLGRKKKGTGEDGRTNLALSGSASASSEETSRGNIASRALDANNGTLWVAKDNSLGQWWSVDMGSLHKVRQIHLRHETEAGHYQCNLLASDDGIQWRPVAGLQAPELTEKGAVYQCDESFRFLKIEFTALQGNNWASLAEVGIYENQWSPSISPYRLCWEEVAYEPGELKVVAYKEGKKWAESTVRTTGPAAKLTLQPDRTQIRNDGRDLSFAKLTVCDKEGLAVPRACPQLTFEVTGPGELVATDNGDATDLVTFSSPTRKAYNGLALAIVRAKKGAKGPITLKVTAPGLPPAEVTLRTQ